MLPQRIVGFPIASEDTEGPPMYRVVELRRYNADFSWDQGEPLVLKPTCGLEKARENLPNHPGRFLVRCFPAVARVPGRSADDLTDRVAGYEGTSDYGAGYVARLRKGRPVHPDSRVEPSPPRGVCVLISIDYDAEGPPPKLGRISDDTDSLPDGSVEVGRNKLQLFNKWRAAWDAYHNHGRAVLVMLPHDAAELDRVVVRFPAELSTLLEKDAARLGTAFEWNGIPPTIHGLESLVAALDEPNGPVLLAIEPHQLDELVNFIEGPREAESLPAERIAPWALRDAAWKTVLANLLGRVMADRAAKGLLATLMIVAAIIGWSAYLSCARSYYERPDYYIHVAMPEAAPDGKPWDEPFPLCEAFKQPDIAVVLQDRILRSPECSDAHACNIPVYLPPGDPPWSIRIIEDDSGCPGDIYTSSEECGREVVLETEIGMDERVASGIAYQITRTPLPAKASKRWAEEARQRQRCFEGYASTAKSGIVGLLSEPSTAGAAWLLIAALGAVLAAMLAAAAIAIYQLAVISHRLSKQVESRASTLTTAWDELAAVCSKALVRLSRKLGYEVQDERALGFHSLVRSRFDTSGDLVRLAEPLVLFEKGLYILENPDDAIGKGTAQPKWRFYRANAIVGYRFVGNAVRAVVYLAAAWVILFLATVGWHVPVLDRGLWYWVMLLVPFGLLVKLVSWLRLISTQCRFELVNGNTVTVSVPFQSPADREVLEEWFSGIKRKRSAGDAGAAPD